MFQDSDYRENIFMLVICAILAVVSIITLIWYVWGTLEILFSYHSLWFKYLLPFPFICLMCIVLTFEFFRQMKRLQMLRTSLQEKQREEEVIAYAQQIYRLCEVLQMRVHQLSLGERE